MNTLPEEVLRYIFKKLPQADCVRLTTVCKSFNEIITNSKIISTIYIGNESSDIKIPTRIFSKAVVVSNNADAIQKALQATGNNIVDLEVKRHETTLVTMVLIFNLLPNVKKVKLYYLSLIDTDEDVRELAQPKSNITFDLHESDPRFFKVLTHISLVKIDIRLYGDTPYYNFMDFLPFMKVQKELKSYAMAGIYESTLMYGAGIPRGDYQLSNFEIFGSDLEEWIYLESFLLDHKNSLERLTVSRCAWDPSSTIKSCKNLKFLKLGEDVTIDALDENIESIEELSIKLPNANIIKFPNVKKLYMKEANAENNAAMSAVMSKVEDLCVRYGVITGINFPNVIKMKLINIDEPIEQDFFRTHTKVEELDLENIFYLQDELLEVIAQNLTNLQKLRIFGFTKLTARAFRILRDHCKNLRLLDMRTWSQSFSIADWKCLHEIDGMEIYVETFNF